MCMLNMRKECDLPARNADKNMPCTTILPNAHGGTWIVANL